jgi:hypothetical protein
VLKAIKLKTEIKLGDKEAGGRVYYYDRSNRDEGIRVPALNEPLPKLFPEERTIWERQSESPPLSLYSYMSIFDDHDEMELLKLQP